MAALSPRSANIMVKPKATIQQKPADGKAVTGRAARVDGAQKNLPPPPPSVVTEPGEDAERYSTGVFLGKGGFAVCYEGTLMRNRRVFAMKVVKSDMKKKMQEKVIFFFCFRNSAFNIG